MEKDYNYFHNLLIGYFQGTITENEIRTAEDLPFEIQKISEWSVFLDDFETAFNNYDKALASQWFDYKEYAKDTAPTVKGLVHSLSEFVNGRISQEQFIEWAAWHNMDCGETTSGQFENNAIEFFCLYFIPERYKNLDMDFYKKVIPLIEKSNDITYGKFLLSLYLLIDAEKKSMYFFLKEYLNGNKNEKDLDNYLTKKFNRNLPNFNFDLSKFPYKKELDKYREEKLSIDDFMNEIMV